MFCNAQSCVMKMEIQQDTLVWKEAQGREIPYPHISLFLFWRFCSFRFVQIKKRVLGSEQ